MTTNELTGRELAEAAARAMGWTDIRIERLRPYRSGITGGGGMPSEPVECLVGNPPDGSSPPPLIRHVDITVDKCLAWLHERGIVNTASSRKVCEVQHMSTPEMTMTPREGHEWISGTDLREALARLVVAVKEREAKA